jgi:hypothetical protein
MESNIEQHQRPQALEGCEKIDRNRIANSNFPPVVRGR